MKKFTALCLSALVCTTLFAGCKKSDENSNVVRVAYFPNITHTQALVMKSKGLLEKELGNDLSVKWTAFNAGPAEVEALFAGEIDLGYIGPVPAVSAYVKSKGDMSIIAGATNGGAVLVTRKDIVLNDVKGLNGRKIAVPQLGNTQHLSLLNILAENNMSVTTKGGQVEVVAAANSDIKTLMDNKQVDAAIVPEPWGSILQNDIGANVLMDYEDIWMNGNYSTAVVIASKDFTEKHPDLVEKFLKVHKDATLYINENLNEAKDIVNKEIELTTKKSFDKKVLDSAFKRMKISEIIPKESIFAFAQISKKEGFITETPDDSIINEVFLNKVK